MKQKTKILKVLYAVTFVKKKKNRRAKRLLVE